MPFSFALLPTSSFQQESSSLDLLALRSLLLLSFVNSHVNPLFFLPLELLSSLGKVLHSCVHQV